MPKPLTTMSVLDREFLEVRARILELAAFFDRLDRGGEGAGTDPRLAQLRQALQVLLDAEGQRAERVQLVFSSPYENDWRQKLGL